jgi:hypothetical protein
MVVALSLKIADIMSKPQEMTNLCNVMVICIFRETEKPKISCRDHRIIESADLLR